MLRAQVFTLTTDAGGAASVDGEVALPGRKIYAVEFILGTITSGAATVTLLDVGTSMNKTILTLTNPAANSFSYVRSLAHDNAGTALTGTAGGDRLQPLVTGKLRVTVAAGGATKAGSLTVWYEEVK